MKIELCPKCNQPLEDGQLILGQAWNGDGGEHAECPAPVAAVDYAPADSNTGVYEIPAEPNPYKVLAARVGAAEDIHSYETRQRG